MSLRLDRLKRNYNKHFNDLDYKNAIEKLEDIIYMNQKKERQEKEDDVLNTLEKYKELKYVTKEVITHYKNIVTKYSMNRTLGYIKDDPTIASTKKINDIFKNYLDYMQEELNRDLFKINLTDAIISNKDDDLVTSLITIEKVRLLTTLPSSNSDAVFKNFADDPEKYKNDYKSKIDDIYEKYKLVLEFWSIFNKYENIEFVDDNKIRLAYTAYNTYGDIIEFYKTLKPTEKSVDKINAMEAELINNINRSLLILSNDSSLKLYKLFKNSCGFENEKMKFLIDSLKQNALFGDLLADFQKEKQDFDNIYEESFNNLITYINNEDFKIFFIIYHINLRSNFLKEFTIYLSEMFSIFTEMSLHIENPENEKWDNKVYSERQLFKYLNEKVDKL